MKGNQSARLERKKLLGDPVLLITIIILIAFLSLFILYPLAMLLADSVYVRQTELYSVSEIASGETVLYAKNGEKLDDGSKEAAYVRLVSPDDPENTIDYDFDDAKANTSKYVEDYFNALGAAADDRFKTE